MILDIQRTSNSRSYYIQQVYISHVPVSMSVKVHTHSSNRERPNQAEKKVVFKGVLDNPFRLHWYDSIFGLDYLSPA